MLGDTEFASRGGSRLEARTAGREAQAGEAGRHRTETQVAGRRWPGRHRSMKEPFSGSVFMVQLRFRFRGSGSVPGTS